jgi:hypothetical protein
MLPTYIREIIMPSPICKVGLLQCTFNGLDTRALTHCIRIYETMCKPYRTAEVVLLNTDGQVNGLNPDVGDEIVFSIQDAWGQTYNMTSYVTAIPEQFTSNIIRQDMVTLGTVTGAFMRNKGSVVQWSGKNMPITDAIAAVHGMYIATPINVLLPSLGMIAGDNIGSYIASGDHAFKVIHDLCDRCTYGAVSTGSTVYFENKYSAVVGPLEHILNTSAIGGDLIDSDTWGYDYRHIFGGGGSEKQIIMAKIYHKDGQAGGDAGDQVKQAKQQLTLFNQQTKFPIMNAVQSIAGNAKLLKHVGPFGGMSIKMVNDPQRNPQSNDPANSEMAENAFKSLIKDGTNYLIKFPIESGFKAQMTVGNRAEVTLRAPTVDSVHAVKGPLLIADLMHECYFDNRELSGTSTMRGVKVGGLT